MQKQRTGILIGLILIGAALARADTTWVHAGSVSGTWALAGSPYMVYDGWIEVPEGSTLTIHPGVRVYFNGPFLMIVRGHLNACATPDDFIYFTALDVDTMELAWRGIFFDSTGVDTSCLSYCVFEHANGPGFLPGTGGAVQMRASSPNFNACTFQESHSAPTRMQQPINRRGGAVYLLGSRARFENCVLSPNDPGRVGLGGAVFCEGAGQAVFDHCIMQGNVAGSGGAVAVRKAPTSAYPRFQNCEFVQNIARFNGGAVHMDSSNALLINCTITENQSSQCGGAIYAYWHGNPLVEHCTIAYNESFWGGAVFTAMESHPTFQRCVLNNNIAGLGGAMYVWRANPMLEFCTAAHNTSTQGDGGGIYLNEAQYFWARHTIIAYSYGGEGVYFRNSPNAIFQYCDIGTNSGGPIGYWPDQDAVPEGLGLLTQTNFNQDSCDEYMNIYFDPQFVDGAAGDYHLNWNSPCIDAGDPAEEHWDPDGTRLDIGAFYRDATPVSWVPPELPQEVALAQNYPNPFNAATRIAFDLPQAGETELSVYDLNGRQVTTLLSRDLVAGHHSVNFDAATLPSGVYIYRLKANGIAHARKMALLK